MSHQQQDNNNGTSLRPSSSNNNAAVPEVSGQSLQVTSILNPEPVPFGTVVDPVVSFTQSPSSPYYSSSSSSSSSSYTASECSQIFPATTTTTLQMEQQSSEQRLTIQPVRIPSSSSPASLADSGSNYLHHHHHHASHSYQPQSPQPSQPLAQQQQQQQSQLAQQARSKSHKTKRKTPPLPVELIQPPVNIIGTQDILFSKSNSANNGSNLCAFLLTLVSVTLIVGTLPFSLFLCIKVVQEYERAVIFRLGRLVKGGAKGPGIFFIIPCIDSYSKVDLRTVSFDVPPQEILSRDSVTVSVDAVVYFRISNATVAVSNVEDYGRSTRLLAATTLRNVLGTKDLSQLLSERETISHIMQSSLDEATDPWGVKVERVEIKDVRLPVQLQRAMAAEAEAAREARAKVIAAEGEQRASRALKEAAEVMSGNPAALQLRYLQTLNSIAAEKNSTIVFPIPLEMFRGFMTKPKISD